MQGKASSRIKELDILRALAIAGVIFIHSISYGIFSTDSSSLGFKFYILIDQVFRFAVPLFVGVSGYLLALKYRQRKLVIREFFVTRVLRIIPWYLFLSGVILLYLRYTHWWAEVPKFPLWKLVFLGKADYHLYFIPMIFQLYLLFPLLFYLVGRYKFKFVLLFFVLESGFYFILSLYSRHFFDMPFLRNDQQQYLFFGTWIFFFILGIWVAVNDKVITYVRKYKNIFLFAAILFFLWDMLTTYEYIYKFGDLTAATRSTKIPVLLYASSFLLISLSFMDYLGRLGDKLLNVIAGFGQRSFLIYLVHTIILRIFLDYVKPISIFNVFALAIFTTVSSDYLAYILQNTASGIRSRFLVKTGLF